MRAINLLPRDDARGSSRRPDPPVLVGVIGVVFVSAALAAAFLIESGKTAGKRNELANLEAQLALIPEPPPTPAGEATPLVEAQSVRVGALSTVLARRVAWDRVLRGLSLVLPEDVWFTSLSAKAPLSSSTADPPLPNDPTAAPTGFTISGHTYSHEGVARLLSRLSVLPDLTDVELQQSRLVSEPGRPTTVNFTIVANVRPAGATS